MDPISAFSLAGTVIQFVDFGAKVVSRTRQLYQDGQLSVHKQAKYATEDLLDFSTKLQQSQHPELQAKRMTDDDKALAALCQDCDAIAKMLLNQLAKLQLPENGNRQRWNTVGQALRSICAQEQLAELDNRLAGYRRAMDSRILGLLRQVTKHSRLALLELLLTGFPASNKIDLLQVQQSRRFENLDETTQQIVRGLLDIRRTVAEDLNPRIQALTQILDRGEVVITIDKTTEQRRVFSIKQAGEHAESVKDKELCKSVFDNEQKVRKDVAKEVLKNLWYPTIKERFEEVSEAHQKTFNWVFQSHNENTMNIQSSNFVKWLRHDGGLYWINGKAGSGKSTLMKYIYNDPRMRKISNSWAAASNLCVAGFFFWKSGTRE